MPKEAPESLDDLLDRCIDVLLAGGDWEGCVPTDHPDRDEVIELMRVAKQLSDAFGPDWPESTPGSPSGREQAKRKGLEGIQRLARGGTDWFHGVRDQVSASRRPLAALSPA